MQRSVIITDRNAKTYSGTTVESVQVLGKMDIHSGEELGQMMIMMMMMMMMMMTTTTMMMTTAGAVVWCGVWCGGSNGSSCCDNWHEYFF